jgi:hypothetical protein
VAICSAIIADDAGESDALARMGNLLGTQAARDLLRAVEQWIDLERSGQDAADQIEEIRQIANELFVSKPG